MPYVVTDIVVPIAKRGFLLSRGHRADLATTKPKRFELRPGSRAELSFKTVYNTFENRRMHHCWWGDCGHVMALRSNTVVCRQSGRMGSVQAAHTSGGNLIEGAVLTVEPLYRPHPKPEYA